MAKYVVTHGDLDGVGAAILSQVAYNDVTFTFFAEYTTIDNYIASFLTSKKAEKDVELIITDICPSQSVCEDLDKVSEQFKLRLFDHHKTRQWVEKYPWAKFDISKSGTQLFYEYVLKESAVVNPVRRVDWTHWKQALDYKNFVAAVDAWDLWKLDSPHRSRGEGLNALFKFLRMQEFTSIFAKDPDADEKEPIKTLLHYINKEKEYIINRAIANCQKNPVLRRDSLGRMYIIIFTTDYVSEVCHAILGHPDFEDLQYVVAYSPLAETCSLRTTSPSMDVSNLAKHLGGGGHKDAAGFHYPLRAHIEENIYKMIAKIEY
jgi:oligoribonuclease NrnB/cAMP/cGMP phosphodiesterase (DHH superfamily)